jgi:site-specific DNA recombinase
MKAAAIYTRISKDHEGQAVGVDRQEGLCRELAAAAGLDVVDVFSDNDVSASTASTKPRPNYKRMIKAAEAGNVKTIIAYSSSRLTRRMMEHEGLIELAKRHGVRYKFVMSPAFDLNTADGKNVARILAANDTAEAERISERVKATKEQHRAAGRQSGGWRPYGYRVEQDTLTVDETEAEHVRRICRSLLAGESIRGLVAELNAAGVPCATGRPWHRQALQRVLKSRHLAGLVGDDTATAVHHLMSDPARRMTPGPEPKWLLSNIARCGVCGGPIVSSRTTRGKGRYQCAAASHVVRNAEAVDEYVRQVVIARLSRPDASDLFPTGRDTSALHAEAVALRARLDQLAALFADGSIDGPQLAEGSHKLRTRLDEVTSAVAKATRDSVLSEAYTADPEAFWAAASLAQRRALVKALVTITIHRTQTRGRRLDPEAIHIEPR